MYSFLNFSDAAKYADIAKNIVGGYGYSASFSFFIGNLFTAQWILPVMPVSIAAFFKIFGVNDFVVIAASFFYFILTLVFVYLLTKKIFASNLVAWLSTLAVGFNYDLIHYAVSGASESPFIFEIVAASYFVALKKKWATILAGIILILMYFTRPQAFIYIAGIILYWLLLNLKARKAWIYFGVVVIAGILIDHFILTHLSGKYFIYSVLGRGTNVLSQVAVSQSASDQLRSGVLTYNFSIADSLKKVFYNLYNFYKLLPQIISPYLFALFIIGLSVKGAKEFKIAALFMVIVTLVVTAASIPFFRYIHPVIPLVYIISIGTLLEIINRLQIADYRLWNRIKPSIIINLVSIILVIFFAVGPTVGILLLDSRYERNTHNVGKPPVYVQLSYLLRDNTNKNQVIVTNLDTWGSWYGERKTVWFPLEPKQLINTNGKIPFDAIFLTSYLIDDPNYYMGSSWRSIFENPKDISKWKCDGCSEIAKEFKVAGVYKVNAADDYERQDATAVLLIHK